MELMGNYRKKKFNSSQFDIWWWWRIALANLVCCSSILVACRLVCIVLTLFFSELTHFCELNWKFLECNFYRSLLNRRWKLKQKADALPAICNVHAIRTCGELNASSMDDWNDMFFPFPHWNGLHVVWINCIQWNCVADECNANQFLLDLQSTNYNSPLLLRP